MLAISGRSPSPSPPTSSWSRWPIRIATPLAWYPRLRDASPSARANLELMAMGIHWPELDEDLGIAGMLQERPAA